MSTKKTPITEQPTQEPSTALALAAGSDIQPSNPMSDMGLDDFSGLEDFNPNDFIIPRIKIVQPTSQEGTAGTFRNNLTNEEVKTITIIGIKIERGRVMWEDGKDTPICRSFDGMIPDPKIETPQCYKCAEIKERTLFLICPKAQWTPDPKNPNANVRPDCDETFSLLALNLDSDNTPFWIQFSGTSIKPVKRLVSSIALRKKKLFQFKMVFSLIEERGEKGKYYALNYSPPVLMQDHELLEYAEAIATFRHAGIRKTIEHEETLGQQDKNPETAASADPEAPPSWVNETE